MKRKAISIILALVLCAAFALPAFATGDSSGFTDVDPNAWYAAAVNAMKDGDIFSDYGDGTFRPEQAVTLAELLTVIARLEGREVYAFNAASEYADTPAIRGDALSELGRLAELSDLQPTREHSELVIPGISYTSNDQYFDDGHFCDESRIVEAYAYGVTNGVDEKGTCDPYGVLTRGQLAQMCYNVGWTTAGCWERA